MCTQVNKLLVLSKEIEIIVTQHILQTPILHTLIFETSLCLHHFKFKFHSHSDIDLIKLSSRLLGTT